MLALLRQRANVIGDELLGEISKSRSLACDSLIIENAKTAFPLFHSLNEARKGGQKPS